MKHSLYPRFFPQSLALLLILLINLPLAGQTTFRDSILHDGIYRQYLARIPATYTSNQPHELVFVLHGGGGSANLMFAMTRFDQVADTAGFILVFPQGVFTGVDGRGRAGHHWADGRTTTLPDVNGIDDVGFISNLMDTLSAAYNIDPNRVYAAGASNGGYMTQLLACELSDRLAAVATVAATFPDSLLPNCTNVTPTSILIMNGTQDQLVPTYTGGMASGTGGWVLSTDEMINIWRNNNGCDTVFHTFEIRDTFTLDNSTVTKYVYPNCQNSTEIVHYKIFGGGHAWPGQQFGGTFTGNSNKDINANLEIWHFFNAHTKSVTTSTAEIGIKESLNVYPNPFEREIHVAGIDHQSIHHIEIIDLFGKTVWQAKDFSHQAQSITLQSDFLKTGIYFLKIQTRGETILKKIVKNTSTQ
ncbi:MAG: T9SS type A sorting domain-containing protein [Bacteroidota bacterium]